mmetsp:Transcript_7910/g.17490  ORF Transcript_7910/g.17490 Transcript_7910/m.17490 type:complete len:323 (+) Transcript_7910:233-1201(+)
MTLVVPGREDSHQQVLVHDIESQAVLLGLMTSHYEPQTIPSTKRLCDVPPELRGHASPWRFVYTKDISCSFVVILYGIRPQHVVEPVVVQIVESIIKKRAANISQIIHLPRTISYPTMYHKHALVNKACKREVVKHPLNSLKQVGSSIPSQTTPALLEEAVPLVHAALFMVAADEPNALWQQYLESKQQSNDLNLMIATIHEVTIEDKHRCIVLVRATIAHKKEQEIPKVSMQVAKNTTGCLGLCNRRLHRKYLSGCGCQKTDVVNEVIAKEVLQETLLRPFRVKHVFLPAYFASDPSRLLCDLSGAAAHVVKQSATRIASV